MADPGFPVGGGTDPLGGANLQHIHFLTKTYAKMKEMDPVGGAHAGGAPPGSANEHHCTNLKYQSILLLKDFFLEFGWIFC